MQAAQEGSERAALGQQALDTREARVSQHESDLKDLNHALQAQHAELQRQQQQLQVMLSYIAARQARDLVTCTTVESHASPI